MNHYKIEQKIHTLTHCAVINSEKKTYSVFSVDGISFSHWDFNHRDGWIKDDWIAKFETDANNFEEAFVKFRMKLIRIIPRISLISQSYIEFINEPYLISKQKCDTAYIFYTFESKVSGLMFLESEKNALEILLDDKLVSNEFYYYWNDAVNTIGYSAKLLIMFSAIESLVKKRDKLAYRTPDDLRDEIFGKALAKELFEPSKGVRHRLVHGEYFTDIDTSKNYLNIIHECVINFFNKNILRSNLINDKVVDPQRNFYGNKNMIVSHIKNNNKSTKFSFKKILRDLGKYKIGKLKYHTLISPNTNVSFN